MDGRKHQLSGVRSAAVSIGLHIIVYTGVWRLATGQNLTALALALAVILIWISVWDFATREIPDTASLLLFAASLWHLTQVDALTRAELLTGGTFWPLAFYAVARLYSRFRHIDGLGFGDVKLMAGVGLLAGVAGGAWVVALATIGGILAVLVTSVVSRQSERDLGQQAIAFGPFLCLSLWANLLIWRAI